MIRLWFCVLSTIWALGACAPPCADTMPGDGCPPKSHAVIPGKISEIRTENFLILHQSGELLLIDSRDPWFYRQGRIPGAICLATGESMCDRIESLLPEFRKAKTKGHPIVVYCNGFGCHDARTVCRAIAKSGFDVTKFGGGWKAWKKFDLPVESASQEDDDLPPQTAS